MLRTPPDGWDVRVGRPTPPAPTVRPIADELPSMLLAVRHIGPRRARRLIDALGADWRWCVELAPERVFGTVRGIGAHQAQEAAESWRSVAQTGSQRRGYARDE